MKSRKYRIRLAAAVLAIAAFGWAGNMLYEEYRDRQIMNATAQFSSGAYEVQSAIMEKRRYPEAIRIIHIEPVQDGVLVLYRRFLKPDSFDIHADYVRWTWRGWEAVWGGAASGGNGAVPDGLFVEYLPPTNGVARTPFPMVYGVVIHDDIRQVRVTDGQGFESIVKPITVPWGDQRSWFAWVPQGTAREITVSGIDADGEVVTEESFIRYEFLTEDGQSSGGNQPSKSKDN